LARYDLLGRVLVIPLEGIRVLDFSTLLPGPLATLILAEAGAQVIKIERPERGDEMRSYTPEFGVDSVNFALLNRGKESVEVDLKSPEAGEVLRPLIERADVLVEQFRPGVMERLRLGYDELYEVNPRLIYCSITGYGKEGPRAGVAAHDLNYVAEAGLLGLTTGADGAPAIPQALLADIGGGAYPAVMNILLGLLQRERTGEGAHLDISMSDNIFTFLYWALGNGMVAGDWPEPGAELVTGGSPRYNIYRTADGRYVAAAPLEERFWQNFCDLLELEDKLRDDSKDPEATFAAVTERIALHPASHWRERFEGHDVCCSVVRSVREAMEDEHFNSRGLFDRVVESGTDGRSIPALPVPVMPEFRRPERRLGYPSLGEANERLEKEMR
jgi:crotonobetainyl-CoA:carnitine CoA-transferase CaiB-like acyl-CoA transferase